MHDKARQPFMYLAAVRGRHGAHAIVQYAQEAGIVPPAVSDDGIVALPAGAEGADIKVEVG